MVSRKHFKIKVDHDGSGLIVSVSHLPTGLMRAACPLRGESVHALEEKLVSELLQQFCVGNEFTMEVGRCKIDGKVGSYISITHLPTGKSKSIAPLGNRSSREVRAELIDTLVAELWREGIRPRHKTVA